MLVRYIILCLQGTVSFTFIVLAFQDLVSADSWHLPPSLVSLSLYLETPLLRWTTGLNGPPLESAEHSGDAIFPLLRW